MLGVAKPDDINISGVDTCGIFIFNQNNNYYFGSFGVGECVLINHEKQVEVVAEDLILISKENENFDNNTTENQKEVQINTIDFLNSVDNLKNDNIEQASNDIEDSIVYMQLPEKGYNGYAYGYYSFIPGEIVEEHVDDAVCAMTIRQFRYEICTLVQDNKVKGITDIVTSFRVTPNPEMWVHDYAVRMSANYIHQDILGESYLESDVNSTYTFSGGITAGNILSGNAGIATTNTYDTNGQEIFNDFFAERYRTWECEPIGQRNGKSWEVEPCIRIVNNDIAHCDTHASSSIQYSRIYTGQFGYQIPEVEVEESWSYGYLLGDINFDGFITNTDLILLSRYLVDLIEFDVNELIVADLNGDGMVTNADQVILARIIVNE